MGSRGLGQGYISANFFLRKCNKALLSPNFYRAPCAPEGQHGELVLDPLLIFLPPERGGGDTVNLLTKSAPSDRYIEPMIHDSLKKCCEIMAL